MHNIPQKSTLLAHVITLLEAHRELCNQERVFQRVVLLVLAEILTFTRHTLTQLLMSVGWTHRDWSGMYRLFSRMRFPLEQAQAILFRESLQHVNVTDLYVVGGDATQTPRTSRKIEGAHWLANPRSPVFKRGIHIAQRWFNGSWLVPAVAGYSLAIPLYWRAAFTAKSGPQTVAPQTEGEAALAFLNWLKAQLQRAGRAVTQILMVGDGHYDQVKLWAALPEGVILMVRSAKNRILWTLPAPDSRKNRRYGEQLPRPQAYWQDRKNWRAVTLLVRGKQRHLQVKVSQPCLRKGAAQRPLFLIVVRGKHTAARRRQPLPFLVNAAQAANGTWQLPLALETLLFWAWQRWELEVAHRQLKSNFGLGSKQCWQPHAAVASVQWSAWVYALLLLAGYRAWGLQQAYAMPTAWWRGGQRWSFDTLRRHLRAALWQQHQFALINPDHLLTQGDLAWIQPALRNAAFGAACY